MTLGKERARRDELVGSLWKAGAEATFSSDVTSSDEIPRTNPLFGLEMAMTRVDYAWGPDLYERPSMPEERLALPPALRAYTLNGVRQLGIAKETVSLWAGKAADFVVIREDLFAIPPERIQAGHADTVVLEGRLVRGSLHRSRSI